MLIEYWIDRARCRCGFVWTRPGTPSRHCACGSVFLSEEGDVVGPQKTFSEAQWQQAVADSIGVEASEVTTMRVSRWQ